LVEMVLVVALLTAISAMVIPAFLREIQQEELPSSAEQFRSLLSLMRAHAALDGKRYRIRFPDEEDRETVDDDQQPLIEREDDPIDEPEVFNRVTLPWAVGATLLGKVWCAEIRPGRPTAEDLQIRRNEIKEQLEKRQEDIDPERPPLVVEVDGTSEWATFVLTEAPRETDLDDLEEHPTIEVILDGITGLAWLQRPFFQEELDLFEEKGWPVVLGQDYTEATIITEDRVLELHEFRVEP